VWYEDAAGTVVLRDFTVPYEPLDDISWFSSITFSRYFQIEFTNGATPQTQFHLRTILDNQARHGQMLSLESFIPSNSVVNLTRATAVGKDPNGIYTNSRQQGLHAGNTTTTPLNASETYRGEWFPLQESYVKAITSLTSDVPGTLFLDVTNVEFPTNGVDTDVQGALIFPYAAGGDILRIQSPAQSRWVRHRYINSNAAQSVFNLQGSFVTVDPGTSAQPLRDLPNVAIQANIVRAVSAIPSGNGLTYVETPIDDETKDPTQVVTKIRDDILFRPLDSAQANQISVGTTPVRLDPTPLANRREVMISNDGETAASVGFSNSITFASNSFIMKPGTVRTWSLDQGVALWGVCQNTGGVQTLYKRNGASASGTATSPTNALLSNNVYSIIDANAETINVSGFTSPSANPIVSVKLGLEAKKQAGQTQQATYIDTQTGSGGNVGSVSTTSNVTAVNNQLYLAAISRENPASVVTSVSGMGLTWVKSQTIVYASERVLDVWYAIGTVTVNQQVVATFSNLASNTHIAVSRYSNVHTTTPILTSTTATGNSASVSTGALSGVNKGIAYLAVAKNNKSFTPGAGYTERSDETTPTGGDRDGLATETKALTVTGSETPTGTLSSSTQWAAISLIINPSPAIDPEVTMSYTVSAVAGPTTGVVAVSSTSDTTYTVDVTGDRAWVAADIPNVAVIATGTNIGGAAADVDHAYLEVTDTTGASTRISIVQGGRELV